MLHFQAVSLPANNRLEVDLGYATDLFTSADGSEFWTRPVNVNALPGGLVPVRYVTDGANSGSVELDRYGRGERHGGEQDPSSLSNCDPFLPAASYTEPIYDPFWFCHTPPEWEDSACAVAPDIRAAVARSAGMIVTVERSNISGQIVVSTCSVTLVEPDLVLTAGHCHTPAEALTGSVCFNYAVDCGGAKPAGYNATFHKVVRSVKHRWLDSAHPGYDYSLLQIKLPPGGLSITPIEMRADLPAVMEQVFGIHHPNGAVKKLSTKHPGFARITTAAAGAITTRDIDVSGGSSGSGLFDQSGRIVGVLSNGAACNLSYFPVATILPDLAAPVGPLLNRDVMLVFDRSGSMSLAAGTGRSKIEEARDAASLFVQLIRAAGGNRIGLVSFSTAASAPVDAPIAAATAATKNALVGPAPYTSGIVDSLAPDGTTTIGGGLEAARLQFPTPGANPHAILLFTDGLENTPPMINAIEPGLAGIDLHAIGFGTEASLDGVKLSNLVQRHDGLYTRAATGLTLKKFFALAFGNIFEAGALSDPEDVLKAGRAASDPVPFQVCDEDTITAVVGWDREDVRLRAVVKTPSGATVAAATRGIEDAGGRTWQFLRIPLPHSGELEGTWRLQVERELVGDVEFQPPRRDVRYFASVLASGGPSLRPLLRQRLFYTGDTINPLVALSYDSGEIPENATVEALVSKPTSAVGTLLARQTLRAPETIDGDTLPARQATLLALEQSSGVRAIQELEERFALSDAPQATGGIFESAGVFGQPRDNLLTVEGNYTFHVRARYGDTCTGTRETVFSIHADVGVDPAETGVTQTDTGPLPDGRRQGTIILVPRDRYGNLLGPGRADSVSFSGTPGTTVTGPVEDGGDGSYTVSVSWDPAATAQPGIVLGQPQRPPIVVQAPPAPPECPSPKPCEPAPCPGSGTRGGLGHTLGALLCRALAALLGGLVLLPALAGAATRRALAALLGGLVLLPALAGAATATVFLASWPADFSGAARFGIGTAIGAAAWLLISLFVFSRQTRPQSADVEVYEELRERVISLRAELSAYKPNESKDPQRGAANALAERQCSDLEASLGISGAAQTSSRSCLRWLTGYGYINLWRQLHRAEEALIILRAAPELYPLAILDRELLNVSTIEVRGTLIAKLDAILKGASVDEITKGLDKPAGRSLLRQIRFNLNRYWDDLRSELVTLRNHVLATILITGAVADSILGLAVIKSVNADRVVAGVAFYLVGAAVGLFGELYVRSRDRGLSNDYGLGLARVLAIPLLSGSAAVVGVVLAAVSAPGTTPTLREVFNATDIKTLITAAVFGLTPGLILAPLRKQASDYKAKLDSSETNHTPPAAQPPAAPTAT